MKLFKKLVKFMVLVASLAALQSYAEDALIKTNGWETSVAAGLSLTKGNSDTLLGNLNWLSLKKWDANEIRIGADGSYGENSGIKNNESLRGFAQYNRLFTDRFFGYLRAEGLHDSIAEVEYRVTLSPGVGYYFIKNAKTLLSGEAGPGVVFEKQGGIEKTYLTARLAERLEQKLTDRARLWQSIEFLPQVDDVDNFIVNAEIGVEADITKHFALRTFVQDIYDNQPALGRKKNDIKLVAGVAYKF